MESRHALVWWVTEALLSDLGSQARIDLITISTYRRLLLVNCRAGLEWKRHYGMRST